MSNWIINNMGKLEVIQLDNDLGIPGSATIDKLEDEDNFTCLSYEFEKIPNFSILPTMSRVSIVKYLGKKPSSITLHSVFFDPQGEEGSTYSDIRDFRDDYLILESTADNAVYYSQPTPVRITIGNVEEEYYPAYMSEGRISGNILGPEFPVFYTSFKFLVER